MRRLRLRGPGPVPAVLLVVLLLAACTTALLAASSAAPAVSSAASAASDPAGLHAHGERITGRYATLESIPATAEVVTVGAYWVNIYGINFQDNTCFITAYVWCRWRGKIDPTTTLEFANAVQDWQLKRTKAFQEPKVLPTGEKYQEMRVSGLFYQPYDLRDYPLDSQHIDMYLEDTTRTLSQAVYVADDDSSGLDASLQIPGWDVIGLTSQAYVHNYQTDFGDLSVDVDATRFTSLLYTVEIERDVDYFIWKLMFPLVVVLLTNWLALLLRPNWIDLRTGMPATALLTLVFLQVTYSSELPELSYLVFMDKIYVMAYAMVIVTLLQVIWSNHKLKRHQLDVDHEVRRFDVASAACQFSVFWSVVIYFILTK